MAVPAGMVRDRKTGKIRRKHKQSAAQRAAHNKHRIMTSATKAKIAKSVRKTISSGRTKTGRRSLVKKAA